MSDVIFSCQNLTKNYGKKQALKGLTLEVKRGRIVGLLGPNGSGKTTLIKLACGLLAPTDGQLLIGGMAPGIESKKIVSYLPEREVFSPQMRAKEAIKFYKDFYADFNEEKAIGMLVDLGLNQEDKIGSMSKGTREKLQLILVMSREAELYLLDEPIGGVDPATRDYILNTIIRNYQENASLIISTHLIDDVEKILDDIIMIKEGQLVLQGSVDEVRAEKGMSVDALFREVFKC